MIIRKLLPALVTVAATLSVATPPVGAATPARAKSLVKELLPSAYATGAGFTRAVEKASALKSTGLKYCPDGAQEAFEDAAGQTGISAQVVACTTAKRAAALLAAVKTETAAATFAPPDQLGVSAIERDSGGWSYSIYWQRANTLELVSLTTNVPASSASSTSTTIAQPPISSAQQDVLSNAAIAQDARLKHGA